MGTKCLCKKYSAIEAQTKIVSLVFGTPANPERKVVVSDVWHTCRSPAKINHKG
jgi:hypothetical protein